MNMVVRTVGDDLPVQVRIRIRERCKMGILAILRTFHQTTMQVSVKIRNGYDTGD